MRISDWSSDVCASDLGVHRRGDPAGHRGHRPGREPAVRRRRPDRSGHPVAPRRGPMTGAVTLAAPAKLTLTLRVTGVRPDGYHLIAAEMVSLDIADALTFRDASGAGTDRTRDGSGKRESVRVDLGGRRAHK